MSALRVWVGCALVLSGAALASAREDAVAQALTLVREAQEEAQDAAGPCKRAVKGLAALGDQVRALKADATDQALRRASAEAHALSAAARANCSAALGRHLSKPLDGAVALLDRAQDAKPATAPSIGTTLTNLAGGLGGLFNGQGTSDSTTSHKETVTTRRTEKVNRRDLDERGDDEEAAAPARQRERNSGPARGEMKATCRHNEDCASNTCFVGRGELGYCTKMCNSFSECPSGFDCKHVGNAPQMICQQDSW